MDFFGFEGKKKKNEDERGGNKGDEEADRILNRDKEDKKYDNYNIDEGREKNFEDKLDESDHKRLENTLIKRIEFDMSQNKKQLKMKLEDKYEMEKIRRWHVKLYNIYVTPLIEMLDPFLQITIGGDFSVQVYSTKKGVNYKVPQGQRGYADKTEVQQNVDKLQRRPFDKIIDIEMRMSYSMINNQMLMVELWDYNTIWMNAIKGYTTMSLLDIVNGNCHITLEITKKEQGRKNPSILNNKISSICFN
jgi:hypothetical protein